MNFLLLGLSTFLIAPLAIASETICSQNSNADYELHLYTDSSGALKQLSLNNIDWGGAGIGELQSVDRVEANQYEVTTAAQSGLQVAVGAHIFVIYKESKISEVVIGDPSPNDTNSKFNCL